MLVSSAALVRLVTNRLSPFTKLWAQGAAGQGVIDNGPVPLAITETYAPRLLQLSIVAFLSGKIIHRSSDPLTLFPAALVVRLSAP